MLYDESTFNEFYLRIANSEAKSIALEIAQHAKNFRHKMKIEVNQQINFNSKMRIIKENIFEFYCNLNCYISIFTPAPSKNN
jgi:hypothetical protein